jgi:hypothetical protein
MEIPMTTERKDGKTEMSESKPLMSDPTGALSGYEQAKANLRGHVAGLEETIARQSALLAQMAAALEIAEPHVAYTMHTAQAADFTTRAAQLSTVQSALTAYAAMSPDPVYAEAKEMAKQLDAAVRDLTRIATYPGVPTAVSNAANERAVKIESIFNRARGEG